MNDTRVIYADVLFFINFSMDYFLLFLTARLLGKRLKGKSAAAASALGGLYAVASVLLPGNSLIALVLHIAVSVLLCTMSIGGCGALGIAVFYGISFLIGGGMTAGFALFNRAAGIAYDPQTAGTGGLPAGWLLLSALGFGLFAALTARRASERAGEDVPVEITVGGETVCLTGLADSGNLLTEPLSGLPVILIPEKALPAPPSTRFRVIPVKTVNGEGILRGFLPERCLVAGRETDCCVALTEEDRAIVPLCLMPNEKRRKGSPMKPKNDPKTKRSPLFRLFFRLFGGKLYYIGGSEALPEPLTPEAEAETLDRLENGEDVSGILIEHNLRLVVYIAKRFDNTGVGIEDLISIGTIGLIKGVRTFRRDKGIKLATYASRCIENEILMYLRKTAGRRAEVSIDEPLSTDGDGNDLRLSDVIGSDGESVYRQLESDEERKTVAEALAKLSPREREIIELRFGMNGRKEHTQKEVADLLGISQSYISRLEKKIIAKLREDIEAKV